MTTPLGQVTGEMQDVREWTTYGTPTNLPTFSATKAYTGAYSVRNGAVGTSHRSFGLTFAAQNSLRAGYWLNHNGLSANDYARGYVWLLRNAAGNQVEISWKRGQGDLLLVVNGTCVALAPATTQGFSNLDQWVHVGLTYSTTRMILWINGTAALDYSGTLPDNITGCYVSGCLGSSTSTATVTVGGAVSGGSTGWAQYAYIDDLYVDGNIANVAEAPPPERFLFSQANGAGAAAQWTPTGAASNYECVDEAVPNDDTDYVKSVDAGLLDLYATADITLPTDYGVVAAIPIVLAKTMAAGPTLKLVAADGVSANLESTEKTPGTSYGYSWESMPLAPDGGIWTETKINAAQFGVKSAGVFA